MRQLTLTLSLTHSSTWQGLAASELIEFVADTQAALTDALDLAISHPGPHYKLGSHTKRCHRPNTAPRPPL